MSSGLLLSESYNQFGWDLYNKVGYGMNDNLFMSTFSILTALSMCIAGARNNTKTQLRQVTRLSSYSDEDINKANLDVYNYTNNLNGDIALNIANQIFPKAGYAIKQDFIDVLQRYYKASVDSLDFNKPKESCKAINDWAAAKTNGKIKDVIQESSINSYTRMVLLNAIYFKGSWLYQFDTNKTFQDTFYLRDGRTTNVQMMRMINKRYRYQDSPFGINASVCELPYVGEKLSMTIILPYEDVDISDVESQLNVSLLNNLIQRNSSKVSVRVFIPKFTLSSDFELSKTLSEMGAGDAFDINNADFSGISDEGLYLSSAFHKTYIDVTEAGSEAAGLTGVIVVSKCSLINQSVDEFKCNRPFIFMIHDGSTIFFIGKYVKPQYSN